MCNRKTHLRSSADVLQHQRLLHLQLSSRLPEKRGPLCGLVTWLELVPSSGGGARVAILFEAFWNSLPPAWSPMFVWLPRVLADRDECGLTHYCMHVCVNTQGSYHCDCNIGYKLASNNHTCVGKSPNSLSNVWRLSWKKRMFFSHGKVIALRCWFRFESNFTGGHVDGFFWPFFVLKCGFNHASIHVGRGLVSLDIFAKMAAERPELFKRTLAYH